MNIVSAPSFADGMHGLVNVADKVNEEFQGLNTILLGSIPGVFIGARFSARAPDFVIRPALMVVLTASGLKLLGTSTMMVGVVAGLMTVCGIAYSVTSARARTVRLAADVSNAALSSGGE